MSVLWVTSFNKKLYETSGKHLIKSFQEQKIYGDLFIGYGGNYLPEFAPNETIIIDNREQILKINNIICKYDLQDTDFAKRWHNENKDIIPIDQGGLMVPCECYDPWAKQEHAHKTGCHHTWFNRNTYRFVNKIFTLNEVINYDQGCKYDYIIWIDCDCVFTKQITSDIIEEVIFDDCKADLTILRGPRKFLEAGLVGYNLSTVDGFDLLGIYIDHYLDREFRQQPIWDDCHILEYILKSPIVNPRVHDLATKISGKHSDVFGASLIKDYISHDKGRHGRKLSIFK